MPVIEIQGIGRVELGDEFMKLSPEQQNATVQEIAATAKKGPEVSTGRAALEGYLSGAAANFSDEVYGTSKASGLPEWMGGFRAPVGAARLAYEQFTQPGEVTKNYERAVAEKRAIQKAAQEQHPVAYGAGELGGAIVGSAAVPGSTAATLPARAVQGAKIGATYGALSGAGAGEDLQSRAIGAGTGGLVGAVTGAAAVPVVEGAIQLGSRAVSPIVTAVRGAINPEEIGRAHV